MTAVIPDGFVTPPERTLAEMSLDEIAASIKAMGPFGLKDHGLCHPQTTRAWWQWDQQASALHSAAIKRAVAPMVGQRWRWESRYNPPCCGCGRVLERAYVGRPLRYCSNACRQRAYRTRQAGAPPTHYQEVPRP